MYELMKVDFIAGEGNLYKYLSSDIGPDGIPLTIVNQRAAINGMKANFTLTSTSESSSRFDSPERAMAKCSECAEE
jgi:hypothetical protein